MANERSYKNPRVRGAKTANLNNLIVPVDSALWRVPHAVSLQELSEILDNNIEDKNPANVINLVPDPSALPANLEPISTFIAVDENFLYVWVNDKWKRVPLTEF